MSQSGELTTGVRIEPGFSATSMHGLAQHQSALFGLNLGDFGSDCWRATARHFAKHFTVNRQNSFKKVTPAPRTVGSHGAPTDVTVAAMDSSRDVARVRTPSSGIKLRFPRHKADRGTFTVLFYPTLPDFRKNIAVRTVPRLRPLVLLAKVV